MATVKAKQLLGQLLIERGLLTPADLERALLEQKRSGEFLGTVLMRLGIVAKEQLLPVLAEQMGIPYVRLADVWPLNPEGELFAMPMIESQAIIGTK